MNKIEVLIVVDAESVLASGNLMTNVYMVDTNQYLGSWNEGQCDLHTVCQDTQMITWTVSAVSEDNTVLIGEFSGDMVDKKICMPKKIGGIDSPWEGTVETQRGRGRYTYNVSIIIDGASFSFSPYLDVQ